MTASDLTGLEVLGRLIARLVAVDAGGSPAPFVALSDQAVVGHREFPDEGLGFSLLRLAAASMAQGWRATDDSLRARCFLAAAAAAEELGAYVRDREAEILAAHPPPPPQEPLS